MRIGEKIHFLLQAKGLKQKDLARFLNTTTSTINGWKANNRNPSSEFIVPICEFFCIDISDFFLKDIDELINSTSLTNKKYDKILDMFNDLDDENKIKIEGMLELKIYEQKIESSDKTHLKEEPSSIYDNKSNLGVFEAQEKKSDDIVEIPVIGKTAAGDFIYITDEGVYDFKIEQQDPRADYALEVDGDSMEPLIKNGTYIEVQETNYVDNGTIAIVKYNDQVTCKKFYNDGNGKIRLKSLNPNYQDIFLQLTEYDDENDSFRIIGKVLI